MENRSLGVIGGMGPLATSIFFDKVIHNTHATKDQEHIDMVILNHATLPDRTSIVLKEDGDLFLQLVQRDLKLLEFAGVSNIVIPCNTAHYFYDKLKNMTDINIINMVEETIQAIITKYRSCTKVGIIATQGTVSSGIYEEYCSKYNIDLLRPDEVDQNLIMESIYNIKANEKGDVGEIRRIISHFITEKDCSCVIIACTEISCMDIGEEMIRSNCVDALDVLVEKSIEICGKKIRTSLVQHQV
jgi:aspartate racemase